MRYALMTLSALAAALLLSLPAHAGEGEPDRAPRRAEHKPKHRIGRLLKRLDANQDGQLARDEVPAKLWTRLARADADGSGSVSKDELKAFRKAQRAASGRYADGGKRGKGGKGKQGRKGRRGRRFERADKNGDGALTADEVRPEVWERISKADADGDGAVTRDELKAFHKAKRGG